MTKSTTRTTKSSAVFLAAVLVAGTIALMSPSFMGGAAAYPDYGMEKKYKSKYPSHDYDSKYKSKDFDKKVIVKKVKCNNININVNGLEIGDISRTTDALGAQGLEADENELGAQGFGNNDNGNDIDIKDNFVFVCINKNNNAGQQPPEPPFVPTECIDCFTERPDGPFPPGLLTQLNTYLASNEVTLGTNPDNAGIVGNVAGLCAVLEDREATGNIATEEQIRFILGEALSGNAAPPVIDRVVECLLSLPTPLITATPAD